MSQASERIKLGVLGDEFFDAGLGGYDSAGQRVCSRSVSTIILNVLSDRLVELYRRLLNV